MSDQHLYYTDRQRMRGSVNNLQTSNSNERALLQQPYHNQQQTLYHHQYQQPYHNQQQILHHHQNQYEPNSHDVEHRQTNRYELNEHPQRFPQHDQPAVQQIPYNLPSVQQHEQFSHTVQQPQSSQNQALYNTEHAQVAQHIHHQTSQSIANAQWDQNHICPNPPEEDDDADSDVEEEEAKPPANRTHRAVATSINQLHHQNGRISQACESCRKKKRKCDGIFPTCSQCIRAMVQCCYSLNVKKRGPQAGVVKELRAQVQSLKLQLEQERNRSKRGSESTQHNYGHVSSDSTQATSKQLQTDSLNQPTQSTTQSPGQSLAALISTPQGQQQAKLFCYHYFAMLNNVLFPILEQSVFDDCCARYLPSMETAPAVWSLTFAAVLAQGAGIYGDKKYAATVCEIARVSAAEIFDQPSDESIRGLLVLTFYTLSTNQLSRASCFLAVISRMCDIVYMSPEIPLIAKFLEDMLCCVRTFWNGLDLMPEGSFASQQRAKFATDWARYERLRNFIGRNEVSAQKLDEFEQANHLSFSETGEALDFFGPPDSRDLDDRNLRWELFTSMVALSESRGEYFADARTSVYYHLCVLTKCERSLYIRSNALMIAVCFFKSQALFYVNELDQAVEYAALVSDLTLVHDLSHSAFNSLMLHFVSQVHLRTNDNERLSQSLRMAHAIADKWELAYAPLENIQARMRHRAMHPTEPFSSVSPPTQPSFNSDARTDHEIIEALNSSDRSRAQHLFSQSREPIDMQSLGLSVNQAFTNYVPPKRTQMSVALASVFQPSQQHTDLSDNPLPLPTVADAIARMHPLWPSLWHPEMKLMRKTVVDASLRSDHPHPHLMQLVSPPSIKLEIEHEQERQNIQTRKFSASTNSSASRTFGSQSYIQTDVSSSSSSTTGGSGSGSPIQPDHSSIYQASFEAVSSPAYNQHVQQHQQMTGFDMSNSDSAQQLGTSAGSPLCSINILGSPLFGNNISSSGDTTNQSDCFPDASGFMLSPALPAASVSFSSLASSDLPPLLSPTLEFTIPKK